jgi:hypothetical protein
LIFNWKMLLCRKFLLMSRKRDLMSLNNRKELRELITLLPLIMASTKERLVILRSVFRDLSLQLCPRWTQPFVFGTMRLENVRC